MRRLVQKRPAAGCAGGGLGSRVTVFSTVSLTAYDDQAPTAYACGQKLTPGRSSRSAGTARIGLAAVIRISWHRGSVLGGGRGAGMLLCFMTTGCYSCGSRC